MSELDSIWRELSSLRRRMAELEALERIGSASYADTCGDADMVDGLHAAASGANAHVLATDANGGVRVDGQVVVGGRCIRTAIAKAVNDNVPTGVLTITTPASGGLGGYWSLKLHVLALCNIVPGVNVAARGGLVQMVHLNKSSGEPYTSAVVEVAKTDPIESWTAGRTISDLTITTSHASNTVTTVLARVAVDGSIGGDAPGVLVSAELIWHSYSSAPVMAVA